MNNPAIALYKALHKKRAYTKLYWDVANVIGIYEALLIEIVERWCELNEERKKLNYFQQGEWWTSATYQEWAERYPRLGTWKSIQKMFLALEKQGYVLSGKFTKGSQAKYYRVNPESIGKLLLSGTLKPETGIVSKSDGTVSECDYAVSKSDGTVSKSDDLYIEDQIIQKDYSNINPPTPQGAEEVCVEPDQIEAKEEAKDPNHKSSSSLVNKSEATTRTTDTSEINSSAAPCDNNGVNYSQHPTVKSDAMFQRNRTPWLKAPGRGVGKQNWHPGFVEFYRAYLSSTPRYLQILSRSAIEGDAINSLIDLTRTDEGRAKIENHWDNYQASLTPSIAPTKYQPASDTIHAPRKSIKLAGKR